MNTLENPARIGDDESVALYHQRLGIVLDSLENGILKE